MLPSEPPPLPASGQSPTPLASPGVPREGKEGRRRYRALSNSLSFCAGRGRGCGWLSSGRDRNPIGEGPTMKRTALILCVVLCSLSDAAGRANALTADGKHKLVIIAEKPSH